MGRPRRQEPLAKLTIRLSPDELARARTVAESEGLSLNRWVLKLIDAVTKPL